jgi:hypothetical protein
MKTKILTLITLTFIAIFLIGFLPMEAVSQDPGINLPTFTPRTATPTPTATAKPTSTPEATDTGGSSGRIHRITPAKSSFSIDGGLIAEILLIILIIIVVIVGAFFLLRRRQPNENKIRKMGYGEFQNWVLKKMRGTPGSSISGVDGTTSVGYPVSIKQADNVGMREVDLFAASVARSKGRNGVIVAFSFSSDAIRGKIRARRSYGMDIQMITVSELIMNRDGY